MKSSAITPAIASAIERPIHRGVHRPFGGGRRKSFARRHACLLWGYTGGLSSIIGPDPIFASAGVTPKGDGTTYAQNVLPVDSEGRGVWVGPGYTNLFTGGPTAAEAVALTAQAYCLQCSGDGAEVSCGYGTATPAAPLTFTATAGSTTFTPTDCDTWMLVASPFVMPYITPRTTVTSAVGSAGGHGLSWLMDARILDALGGDGVNPATCTVAAEVTMGVESGC